MKSLLNTGIADFSFLLGSFLAGVAGILIGLEQSITPTQDFPFLLHELTKIRAGQETDIGLTIEHALTLFDKNTHTKHLILLTDAIPTRGEDPERITLDAVAQARAAGITLSLIGINLEREGEKLAKQIVEIGGGKLYKLANLEEMDIIVLEDYEGLKNR